MSDAPLLDYQTPRLPPRRFHLATLAAAAFVSVGWLSSIILMSGIGRFTATANAVGLGLAILGMLQPLAGGRERVAQHVLLWLAVIGLLL